jgi:hypothetical protein
MAKTTPKAKPESSTSSNTKTDGVLRYPAEVEYAAELAALNAHDKDPRPEGWNLSPKAVRTYLLGGKAGDTVIKPKYLGNQRARYRQELAVGASRRRHLRRQPPGRPGHRRHHRGTGAL